MRRVLLLLFAALLTAACTQTSPVNQVDISAEERAIREMDARWLKAVASRDAAAEAAVFADDGVAYREHVEPLVGPAAYQAFEMKYYSENPKASGSWTTDSIRVASSGDIAVQTGTFHTTGLGANGDREDKGRFVTVWKKVNGQWKVANDIGATTMPEPPHS